MLKIMPMVRLGLEPEDVRLPRAGSQPAFHTTPRQPAREELEIWQPRLLGGAAEAAVRPVGAPRMQRAPLSSLSVRGWAVSFRSILPGPRGSGMNQLGLQHLD